MIKKEGYQYLPRDISWLYFNARVLQEASDKSNPLHSRIRFLGIFSNNLDEFFRVRVAGLKKLLQLNKLTSSKGKANASSSPKAIEQLLTQIQIIVLEQQKEFTTIWNQILKELKKNKIFLIEDQQLSKSQLKFVKQYFEDEVRTNTTPLMLESIPQFPYLREKSIYLAITMYHTSKPLKKKFALIEVPVSANGRFIALPSVGGRQYIILLEDIIRANLPQLFSNLGYNQFSAHIIKITKDAAIDLDQELHTTLDSKISKALKKRRTAKPVRFIYDKNIDASILEYLIKKMQLTVLDNITPGGRIHNFRHFMDFPARLFPENELSTKRKSFVHPLLKNATRITEVIFQRDILLNFPYHKFDSIIDLLREAAIDPNVKSIKICAYRLARNSKVVNALINAARNGKQVTVMLELKARFDEEANLDWKERMEIEGIKVLIGFPNKKVHAKICIIETKHKGSKKQYGFISTGNLNETTSKLYSDACLFTSRKPVMSDINRIFNYLEKPARTFTPLKACTNLWISPVSMRKNIFDEIKKQIALAKKDKPARVWLKLNSLSDYSLVSLLQQAHKVGVEVKLIIRGIYTAITNLKKNAKQIPAISIVDEYLEHTRYYIFGVGKQTKVLLSSADGMQRNLDFRIETAVPITMQKQKDRIIEMFLIQWADNIKARKLESPYFNEYVANTNKKVRSQIETYQYLLKISNNM
jgi:polyphosphate kinase